MQSGQHRCFLQPGIGPSHLLSAPLAEKKGFAQCVCVCRFWMGGMPY